MKKKKEIERQERAKKQKLQEIENKIFEIEDKIELLNKDIQNPEIFAYLKSGSPAKCSFSSK